MPIRRRLLRALSAAAGAVVVAATQRFSGSRNLQDSLGEALALKGDKAGAQAAYSKALSLARDPMQKKRIEGAIARLK